MLKAGFEPWRPNDSMVHEAWKLKGRPILILRRHGLRIPVIIMPEDSVKVHDKYIVRIAAYCHLLERSENASSPYGIVLKAKSYQGITVPNCSWTRQLFHRELQKARQHLNRWKSSKTPPASPPEEFCKGCAFGEPKPLEFGVPQSPGGSLSLPVVPITDGGPVQHSECGDRFNWVAPHETTMKKALKRTT
jgi:hypothetical protein